MTEAFQQNIACFFPFKAWLKMCTLSSFLSLFGSKGHNRKLHQPWQSVPSHAFWRLPLLCEMHTSLFCQTYHKFKTRRNHIIPLQAAKQMCNLNTLNRQSIIMQPQMKVIQWKYLCIIVSKSYMETEIHRYRQASLLLSEHSILSLPLKWHAINKKKLRNSEKMNRRNLYPNDCIARES